MTDLAIIGGTGLTRIKELEITSRQMVSTPYGEPSGPLTYGRIADRDVVFLARHGYGHTIPPHRINYRANMWALQFIGVQQVVAIGSVGGITDEFPPGALAVPDQLIDYTWSREHTFFEGHASGVTHIDFTYPYTAEIRERILGAAKDAELEIVDHGTYAATQGPRLETAAEIDRLERDGCHVVGMTGMPEAALARELGLAYGTCAVVANRAAGRSKYGTIAVSKIEQTLKEAMERVRKLLTHLV